MHQRLHACADIFRHTSCTKSGKGSEFEMDDFVLEGRNTTAARFRSVSRPCSMAQWNVQCHRGSAHGESTAIGRSSCYRFVDGFWCRFWAKASWIRRSRSGNCCDINLLWCWAGSCCSQSVPRSHSVLVWKPWSAHHSRKAAGCCSKAIQWCVASTQKGWYICASLRVCSSSGERCRAASAFSWVHGCWYGSTCINLATGQSTLWAGPCVVSKVFRHFGHRRTVLCIWLYAQPAQLTHMSCVTAAAALPMASEIAGQGMAHHPRISCDTKSVDAGVDGKSWKQSDLLILGGGCELHLCCWESTAENLSEVAWWFGAALQWPMFGIFAACISVP